MAHHIPAYEIRPGDILTSNQDLVVAVNSEGPSIVLDTIDQNGNPRTQAIYPLSYFSVMRFGLTTDDVIKELQEIRTDLS